MNKNDRATAAREAAQAARTARQTQQQAKRSAQDIRQAVSAGMTDVQLGAALDPRAGFNFDPDGAAVDLNEGLPGLPRPGTSPGGAETGGPRPDMFAEPPQPLPDDRDAVLREMGVQQPPPAPQQQQNVGPVPPTTRPAAPQPVHPVLQKLREDLGVEKTEVHDVQIGEHTWSLLPLSNGEVASATRLAEQISLGAVEHEMIYRAALASMSVVRIDGVPTFEVFGVEVPTGTVVMNPLRPPRSIQYLAATRLYDFIVDESRARLADRLYEAYADRCDPYDAVESYMDDPLHQRMTFRCPESGCDDGLVDKPRYIGNEIVLPKCRWHAVPMTIVQEGEPGPLA